MDDWNGKRVYVMGLGRFGGGAGVARYLVSCGAHVLIGDTGSKESLQNSLNDLDDLVSSDKITIKLGTHDPLDHEGVDAVVVNPAVPQPWKHPFISEAVDRGLIRTTEIEILYRLLDENRVIAVTGSAGKSTTSSMIHHGLTELGHRSVLGGNIGGSLLSNLSEINEAEWVVLELSSAMLHWLNESRTLSQHPPRIACITNCEPNHLDWHGDAQHYQASKQHLARCLPSGATLFLGDSIRDWASVTDAAVIEVGEDSNVSGCVVPGQHNARNAGMASSVIQQATGLSRAACDESVRGFEGLPHRLQLVHQIDGVSFYNDSKCTVPGAAVLAVEALADRYGVERIHLIAGGYDKGSELSVIQDLGRSLNGLYAIGATASQLAANDTGSTVSDSVLLCNTLQQAMRSISERVQSGDAVLLSPGCASWDQFENYEHRGEVFTQLAREMKVVVR